MNESPFHEYAKNLAPWAQAMFPRLVEMLSGKPLPEMTELMSALQCAATDSCKCFAETSEKTPVEPAPSPENKREKADAAIKDLVEFLNKMGIGVSVQEVKLSEKDMTNAFFESLFKRRKQPFPMGGLQ